MKCLKTYENFQKENSSEIYEEGDYLITSLKLKETEELKKNYFYDLIPVKIISIEENDVWWYYCQLIDGQTVWLNKSYMRRYMNDKEIKEYEFKYQTNKYNL